jgi:SAM-dependent methyltransferase
MNLDACLDDWNRRIRADAEQVARVREDPPRQDFYEGAATNFRPVGGLPSPEAEALLTLAGPDDVWLDIGAGGGRLSSRLAPMVRRVIALEPSAAMRAVAEESFRELGITNAEVRDGRWPDDWNEPVDVCLAAHVIYDQHDILGFVEAMERWSRRLCVVVAADIARGGNVVDLWQDVHGEPIELLPAAPQFVSLLEARGVRPAVASVPMPNPEPTDLETALRMTRRLLWLAPDSPRDQVLRRRLVERYGLADGRVTLPPMRRSVNVISWEPGR